VPGCDIEQCPYCGKLLISCLCSRRPPLDERLPWAGVWPGDAECYEFGWYCRQVEGAGWVRCAADDPEATEDIKRLYAEATWDRARRRFVLPEPPDSPKPASGESKEPS
jgi:hypothetical protein